MGIIKKLMLIILLAFLLGLTQMVSFAENVEDHRSLMIQNRLNNVKVGLAAAPAPAAPVDHLLWNCWVHCPTYCNQIHRSNMGCSKACYRCCFALRCIPRFLPMGGKCHGWNKLKPVVRGKITTCPRRKS